VGTDQAREKQEQHIPDQTDHYPLMVKAVDVFGKEVEANCTQVFRTHGLVLANVGVNTSKMLQ
jgi:hypothetical protein